MTASEKVIKNRVEEHIEQAVVQMAIDNPALGQLRVSNELRKKGILVSQGRVRSIWLRHDMKIFQKRLKALSTKVEQEGIILDKNHVAAFRESPRRKTGTWRDRDLLSRFSCCPRDLLCRTHQKGSDTFINRRSSTPTPKSDLPSCITGRMCLSLPTCSTTGSSFFFEQHDLKLMCMLTEQGERNTAETEKIMNISCI